LLHSSYNLTKAVGEKSDWSKPAVNVRDDKRLGWTLHARTPYQLIWHSLVTAVKLSARGINTYR